MSAVAAGARAAYFPVMTYASRKKLAAVVLLVGLPVYIGAALYIVSLFDRPSMWVELAVYVGLGVVWAFPLRRLFLGLGKADPDAPAGAGPADRE